MAASLFKKDSFPFLKIMVDNLENKLIIRQYDEDRDIKVVGKLERQCENIGPKRGVSTFINKLGDPLCRIRFYPLHVMLVAELVENGELVGVVRGCIKWIGTCVGETQMKICSILGLRVSPSHRRMGIGLKLVSSVEEWATKNGANHILLAIEKNNVASKNLFSLKCNYVKFSSLVIFIHPTDSALKHLSQNIKTKKLSIDQAILVYRTSLRSKEVYPIDIEMILKENPSLGTWIAYFGGEDWVENSTDFCERMPNSWVIFSIWNTCKPMKLRKRKSNRLKILRCFKFPVSVKNGKYFGFFFVYGIYGEGERVGELTGSPWEFASSLAREAEKNCKAVITELSVCDPLFESLSQNSCVSCIDDTWYLKKMSNSTGEDDEHELLSLRQVGNVFVDPRDF